ncbi:MAG: TolC family protein [Bacteroidaceae bacterium]|nr:TolC family protein [Bacteroidaceae bacterium]
MKEHWISLRHFIRRVALVSATAALLTIPSFGRESVSFFTLEEVISLAQEQSPAAQAARHSFQSSYWTWRNYRASLLPSLSFSTSPYLNRNTDYVSLGDGTEAYVRHNNLKTDLTFDLSQSIWLTGGTLSVKSTARRLDLLGGGSTTYNLQPLTVVYSHSLLGYNGMRWNRRIEPLRYREARKQYAETMELVASQASTYFFHLALAQTNLEIAEQNLSTADTLQSFARGRYNIGTITENELLQLELNKLTEEANVLAAQTALDEAEDLLRTFLNLQDDDSPLSVRIDTVVPLFVVPIDKAMELARQNSPDIERWERQRLQSEENLAYAKANAGLKASVYMQLGLAQTSDDLHTATHGFRDEQYVSVGVSLPILDWGRGRGQVQLARSNLDLTNTQIEQSTMSFEQNVVKVVKQFNLQGRRVSIAHKTMQTAQQRYEVARRLYVMGKSTILDLNSAISEKDSAYRGYVSALSTYWSLFYTLRSLTAYDFQWQLPIEYEYDV